MQSQLIINGGQEKKLRRAKKALVQTTREFVREDTVLSSSKLGMGRQVGRLVEPFFVHMLAGDLLFGFGSLGANVETAYYMVGYRFEAIDLFLIFFFI